MNLPFVSGFPDAEPQIKQQSERDPKAAELQEEIRKYVRLLPEIAEPNLARVWEIKEQIQKGTYLTREVIEETAARLTFRFLRKE